MIYQRRIPRKELFSAQLEMLMQQGRLATVVVHMVGVVAAMLMFWPYLELTVILLGAAAFLILLLLRSLQMSNALVTHRYRTQPRKVFWRLLAGAAATGLVWSGVYVFAAMRVPAATQYIFLLLIVMITAFSIGFSVAIREYFVVFVFTALWPIAWWNLVHYWEQPYNLLIGLVLLAFCALLMTVCDRIYRSFRNMIALNWEREAIAQELGDLTDSLRDRNRQLRDARRQLTDLANVDELTGLGNRRLVNSVLRAEMNRARRAGTELSVILLDVDYFKHYNDTYGHPAGDLVLQKLADLMQRVTTRAGEVVARYGGEEFILILPGASSPSAQRTAHRLRELVLAEGIPHRSSKAAEVITVSQGVVTVQPDGNLEPVDVVKLADAALYQAKNRGRNAIEVAGASSPL
jgi:diguanylate cyclase (GGDEF)-like protein